MAVFTYTVKREIEPNDFFVSAAVDIDVSATDTSFNASATNLSGLVNNDFIYVQGYDNSVNNGWFQVIGASTSIKIDVSAAASMIVEQASTAKAITIQGYYRGLGRSNTIEKGMAVINYSEETLRNQNVSLSGNIETIFFHTAKFYDVQTTFVDTSAEFDEWREFLNSIAGGESFTFDPYGTIANPDAPVPAIIIGNPTFSRLETTTYWQIGFRVRIL